MSVFGKLFSRVLNNRLDKWAEEYNVYIEAQSGFRAGMGTVDNIFVLHGVIKHCLSEGKRLYATFVDFTKAFDYVVRENLWLKLIKFGVRGRILNVIQSMYKSVKSIVKYNNCLSEDFTCYLGVRQGECLSPFLFSLYLNDLESEFAKNGFEGVDIGVLKLFLLLYADDIVIFSETEKGLQTGLDILYAYCQSWKLKVNIQKTKVMVFRKGGFLPQNLRFMYDGQNLEIVNKFVYLGIVFTTGGAFTETFSTLAGQGGKAIFKMTKYLNNFVSVSPRHRLDLFDKLVRPILQYGCEVWGFANAPVIERLHLRFCKRILGVKKSTQNDFIYGELGRTQLRTQRLLVIIKYWFKVLTSSDTKYIRIVYNMMLNDLQRRPTTQNWAASVKCLFESLGFNNVWYFQGVGNINAFLSVVKQRLTDNFIQNWNERIQTSSRAKTYSLFHDFSYKTYLEIVKVEKFRFVLSRIRMSSHRLHIEAGRWHKPQSIPLNERKCLNCNNIEDEFHFILECTRYNEIRKKYIKKYFWRRPNIPKFIELMTTTNTIIIRNLASYVYEAFRVRNQ